MRETLISPGESERRTSLSRTEIDRRVAEGSFPQPIRVGWNEARPAQWAEVLCRKRN